ncbi:MAG TPA: hypothetical protein VK666_12410 [Chryseolinea sp.]|nr:hypothetical protein [Chryseolinea sp.]
MRFLVTLALTIGLLQPTMAQQFQVESKLPTAEADGFYRIVLTPQLGAFTNGQFNNLRLHDTNNKEVPYLFQAEQPSQYSRKFKNYDIIDIGQHKNCCTSVVLHNPDSEPINNITLAIKNAEVTKEATLLGSDDKINWYALKQRFYFSPVNDVNSTSETRTVDFPLSNYAYYKLDIDDSTTAPLNILGAGYYEVTSENGKFTKLFPHYAQIDSAGTKRTFLRISFDSLRIIDKLTLSMQGATYFLRKAVLYQRKEHTGNKGNRKVKHDMLTSFVLSSKQVSSIDMQGALVKELLVVIENEDNPPLKVLSVDAYQLNRYLTAWLKKGEQYSIKVGPADLHRPIYDLAYFTDSIPGKVTTITGASLTTLDQHDTFATHSIFSRKVIIWIAIGIVMVVLGLLAIKMVAETSKASKQ